MNVLHIISGGEKGGSKNHLLNLCRSFKDKGRKSIIVCFMEGSLYDDAKKMGLDIILIRQSKRLDLSIITKINEICVREKIDIINCHGGRANFVCWFLMKKYAAKYVTTVHSDYRDDYRGNAYKTAVYSNINKIALKAFDAYITVSHSFKDMLVERGFKGDRIYVLYNGIDFNKERVCVNKNDVINRYSLGNHEHYVSLVARFHPVKGHKIFFDACKGIIDSGIDAGFILAGDGDIRQELENYAETIGIKNNVYFVGFRQPDEFLALSDFTVLTSFTESFPLVILESALYEKTVVSTDVGGVSMLIEDGVNGYLVQPGDSIKLCERMKELLSNTDKCEAFGKRLYEKASSSYSLENMAEDYGKIYKRILSGGLTDE